MRKLTANAEDCVCLCVPTYLFDLSVSSAWTSTVGIYRITLCRNRYPRSLPEKELIVGGGGGRYLIDISSLRYNSVDLVMDAGRTKNAQAKSEIGIFARCPKRS